MNRERWICPKCGRTLTVRNQEHVCGLYNLEGHFEGRDPLGRIAFDWICSIFDSLGSYDVLPMKTTIAFASGVNIAFLTTKKKGAEISIVLPGPRSSLRFGKPVPYGKMNSIYPIRIHEESELDGECENWLREAYLALADGAR